ncbi:MAG: LuxR C-terminal-related transcriptional regulator [Actinomycetota bacterium]|nr:LuxR C-terminal-related transcriptional regulator [Actinomycetota bacterium]
MSATDLERGRRSFQDLAWLDAFELLSGADRAESLGAEDLELLATSAYMIARDGDFVSALERAHHANLDAGESLRAVRCAFWLGINLATRGEIGQAGGWFSRAQRQLERETDDCVERGYLLVPFLLQLVGKGDWDAAASTAAEAAEIGERFGDRDLFALAVHEHGHALTKLGRVEEGLRLLDEAMLAVTAGELSPIVTGLVYCSVIAYCQDLHQLRRAKEWTEALTRWCAEQPEMVAYTGQCLVHRAEIMQLGGEWGDALEEAQRAGERFAQELDHAASGHREGAAHYRQGEVHRLLGEFTAAEQAYKQASRCGWEPQPGLALLRLAEGQSDAAAGAISRALGEAADPLKRARLLPARVETLLVVGDSDEAHRAALELQEISAQSESVMLAAMAAHASGEVDLARGEARTALAALRRAWEMWEELGAPYEAARARVAIGLACHALGDAEAATLELEAARGVFAGLGASPDLDRVDSLLRPPEPGDAGGLTQRELEVLRLVAAGSTNKAIATDLVLSERTVDRHVSNIFAKLGVSSRTAATAYAYEHRLI